ncbi:MAG: hypothetical protein MI919_34965 [Holophagales bacterium]|nr:hypothetical protein [Holophagales bacterium]
MLMRAPDLERAHTAGAVGSAGRSRAARSRTATAAGLLALGLAVLAISASPAAAQDEPSRQVRAEMDALDRQLEELDARALELQERKAALDAEMDQLNLERRRLYQERKRLSDAHRARRIEDGGNAKRAESLRRQAELEERIHELEGREAEIRARHKARKEARRLELGEIRLQLREERRERSNSGDRRPSERSDALERRRLEIESSQRREMHEAFLHRLEIERQSYGLRLQLLELRQEQDRRNPETDDRYEQMRTQLADRRARHEMEAIFQDLLWELEERSFELRIALLDPDLDAETRQGRRATLTEVEKSRRQIHQLHQSQRRQADLTRLRHQLTRQLGHLDEARELSEEDAAELFGEEIAGLRQRVRELAAAVDGQTP